MTNLYDVTFELPPSRGGGQRKLTIRAKREEEAIVRAALALDDAGEDRWRLVSCCRATS